MTSILKRAIRRLPYLRSVIEERDRLRAQFDALRVPPGHYDSPYPDVNEIRERQHEIPEGFLVQENLPRLPPVCLPAELPGIDLNETHQLELLRVFAKHYRELPYLEGKYPGVRYRFANKLFCEHDAIILYSMLRTVQPARILEIGSGFSSAVMLDTNELFFDGRIQLTFIEPYPERLLSLLTPADREAANLIVKRVQDVPLTTYANLTAGDILFIDSSHVVKTGGALNHLFFVVLPAIASGIYIHIHDIFYPFDYPRRWVFRGMAYNEAYFLHAFLQYNHAFRIEYFNSFVAYRYGRELAEQMPLAMRDTGGSIWLKKI